MRDVWWSGRNVPVPGIMGQGKHRKHLWKLQRLLERAKRCICWFPKLRWRMQRISLGMFPVWLCWNARQMMPGPEMWEQPWFWMRKGRSVELTGSLMPGEVPLTGFTGTGKRMTGWLPLSAGLLVVHVWMPDLLCLRVVPSILTERGLWSLQRPAFWVRDAILRWVGNR